MLLIFAKFVNGSNFMLEANNAPIDIIANEIQVLSTTEDDLAQ
jgi:hypothetical protein